MNRFKNVTHVIFDLDGVLLDTEHLYTIGVQNVVGKYGKTYDWAAKLQVMGLTGDEAAKKIVALLDLPISSDEFYRLVHLEYAVVLPECQMLPGAEKVVRHLHHHKIPIAVATSSSRDSFNLKTGKLKDFFSLFHHVVCGGSDPDVKEGKPKPDIFLVCASRFSDKPCTDKCLVFEDAPNGVKAAIAAGMQTVMVPDENVPLEMQQEAHMRVKSLDETPLELFGLPALKS